MADVEGLSPEDLEEQGTAVEAVVAAALAVVAEQAAASVLAGIPAVIGTGLPAYPWVSLDDVAIVPTLWLRQLDEQVMPAVRVVFDQTAEHVHGQIQVAVDADPTLYGTPEFDVPGEVVEPPIVPEIPDVTAEQLMAAARNRLVGIGDTLWADIRQQIVEGIGVGDSIEQLGKRIEAVAGVAEPRARTIARTEVVSTSNGAAIAQARSAGVPMTKSWLDTHDTRTRPTHKEAGRTQRRVPLDQPFEVGGFQLDFPGDPSGPPQEVINERCAIGFELGIPEPLVAAVGRKTAADPYVRDNQGQFAKTGTPDLSDVTPRTRSRRQSAERERRDIEAQARREAQQAVDMHAARALAELAIEFEELAAKGASPRAMTHRVRARMRRLGLEPSVEQAGQQVTFDPDRHEVIGARPAAGEQVLVVRPGYVWARPGGEALIERPTVIGAAPSSVTSLLTHLPGLHDQKDHGRRYGPGDVRPPRARAPKAKSPASTQVTRPRKQPPRLSKEGLASALRSGIADRKVLTGGDNSVTELVRTNSGATLVRKKMSDPANPGRADRSSRRQADAEVLAAALGEAVGANTPRVERTGEDEVFMEFMAGGVARNMDKARKEAAASTPAAARLGLLDLVSRAWDRHSGNWLVDAEGNPVGVDHAFAFENPPGTFGAGGRQMDVERDRDTGYLRPPNPFNPAFVHNWIDNTGAPEYRRSWKNPLGAEELDRIAERIRALEPQFAGHGRESWWRDAVEVIDSIRFYTQRGEDV